MAKETNYDRLSQVDSSISKYFSKYMAPVLVNEQKKIKDESQKEFAKYQGTGSPINLGMASTQFSSLAIEEKKTKKFGSWSNKDTEDLINDTLKKWQSDPKVKSDIITLTNAFYVELCRSKNGGKDSKKLAEFAEKYVENRLNSLIIEQLARQKVPHDSIDYVIQHAFNGSFLGILDRWMILNFNTDADDLINKKTEELYDANWIEKGAGVAGSLALDGMTGGVGIGGKAIGWTAKKAGVSATKSAIIGKTGAVGIDAGLHFFEYSTDSGQYIEDESESVLGDKDAVKKIQQGALKYRKTQTEFQGQVDSLLQKKIKIRPEEFSDDAKHTSNSLLRNHRGNSVKVFENIKSDFQKNGIAVNAKARIPAWMLNMTQKQNRVYASSFYAMAMEMKRNGVAFAIQGGKRMTLKEVAQRAYDYAHAASEMGKKGSALNISSNVRQSSNGMLRNLRGNNDKFIDTIWHGLMRSGIYFNDSSGVPNWMLHTKTAKQDRALASYFYNLALEMKKNGQEKTTMKGGKVITQEQAAQRAYDYARAAKGVDNLGLDDDKVSAAELSRRVEARQRKLNKMINKSAEQSNTEGTQAAPAVSLPPTPLASQSPQETKEMTDGWGNALDKLGLGDFGTTTKNLGYVLAMLPDMLIGMFTGKNPDMKLGDNLLPLASIIGGSFVKRNPLLRMMLLSYGGLSLLNSAGHAAVSQKNGETATKKIYKTYADEPLDPRITDPVMKGRSMVVNIDNVPTVINISDDAANAYQQGKIPINTLANAVLRKYDENRNLAQQHYEDEMTNTEQLQASRQLK